MRKCILIFSLIIISIITYGQELRVGINFFPVSFQKLTHDRNYLILPDHSSVQLNPDWQTEIVGKALLSGIAFRFNYNRLFIKSELNYFNRTLTLGSNLTPQFKRNYPYKLILRYLTFEVPLFTGYTINYNRVLHITPFAGISSELGKSKTLRSITFLVRDPEDIWSHSLLYQNYFNLKEKLPAVTTNYAAGVELMFYGTFLQLSAKKNIRPLTRRIDPDNANLKNWLLLEATFGFVLDRDKETHTEKNLFSK